MSPVAANVILISMPRKSDIDFKEFIGVIGNLIDARLKTAFEVNNLKIAQMFRESEARLRKDLASKEELKQLEAKMATKDDIQRIEKKIDNLSHLEEKVENLDSRFTSLELKNRN